MKNKIIHTSEINVLAHLLSSGRLEVAIYDPYKKLIIDDEHTFTITSQLKDFEVMEKENLCVINISAENISVLEAAYIIEFNSKRNYTERKKIAWQFINNPGGTMRWLYSSEISKPWFLSFYNFNYWKAACYKIIIKTLFFIRFKKIASNGNVTIHSNKPVFVNMLLNKNHEYSIFTGTHGQNRKIILAVANNNTVTDFFKIALNKQSSENILNEYHTLEKLNRKHVEQAVIPKATFINEYTIRLNNIRPMHTCNQKGFSIKHALFLENLYDQSFDLKNFTALKICDHIKMWLQKAEANPKVKIIPFAFELYKKLHLLNEQLNEENPKVPNGICHGDFTKWNCYEDKNKMYVYDWELSKNEIPLLYDFFHFIIQGAVYAANTNYKEIEKQLNHALQTDGMKKIITRLNINASLHLQLYLLHNASYYLQLYLSQQKLHKEVEWLFKTWNGMISLVAINPGKQSQRRIFTDRLFDFLKNKKYVLLKSTGKTVDDPAPSSDIDLLVLKRDIHAIIQFTKQDARIQKLKCVRKSFMTTLQLFFSDNSFLSIDLLNAFHRKSIEYINADLLLMNAVEKNSIKILPPEYDYLYIFLFYQINFSGVPEKYAKPFKELNPPQEKIILETLIGNTGINAAFIEQTFSFSSVVRTSVFSFLKKKKENTFLKRLIRQSQYCKDIVSDFFQNRGMMLTFSGVDGAGKSTILQEVKELLESKYRKKVVVIRHRPSMLPILSAWKYGKEAAEQRCIDSLPRKGTNKNALSSLLRFGYYYSDYVFGQFIVYAKYVSRGYVVLYDRYYFDFIADGKRSNITVNKNFIKALYCFVYKPELNVFLYAQPDVILKRKKELSAEDIAQLTKNYTSLFKQLGNTNQYICIENIDKQKTLNKIEDAFIQLN